ncbi:MAG: M15 family metallopeptidase [Bacteroidales bacterium]|nr:M15 family metallopeptidase [Bacteroidales bacterium]
MIRANIYHFFLTLFILLKVLLLHQFYSYNTINNKEIFYPLNISERIFYLKESTNSELEKTLTYLGLIDVQKLDSTIIVDLKYASKNNVFGVNFYGKLNKAFLNKDAAYKIVKASKLLKQKCKDCRLVILDAARPLTFQKKMWLDIKLPSNEKEKFVTSPEVYSLHNFGAAVDVTIYKNGKYLDMGSDFDEFSERSFTIAETYLLKNGVLTYEQYKNRLLLREIMTKAGFSPIETEWWHFNSCSRIYAINNYKLLLSHSLKDYFSQNNIKPKSKYYGKIFFKVQILSSSYKLTGKENIFKNEKVDYYFHDNLFKYVVGKFNTFEEAFFKLQDLKNKGFNDAFVVAFYKDIRINIKDAIELMH